MGLIKHGRLSIIITFWDTVLGLPLVRFFSPWRGKPFVMIVWSIQTQTPCCKIHSQSKGGQVRIIHPYDLQQTTQTKLINARFWWWWLQVLVSMWTYCRHLPHAKLRLTLKLLILLNELIIWSYTRYCIRWVHRSQTNGRWSIQKLVTLPVFFLLELFSVPIPHFGIIREVKISTWVRRLSIAWRLNQQKQ